MTRLEEIIENALKHSRPAASSLTRKRSTCTFETQANDVWSSSSGRIDARQKSEDQMSISPTARIEIDVTE